MQGRWIAATLAVAVIIAAALFGIDARVDSLAPPTTPYAEALMAGGGDSGVVLEYTLRGGIFSIQTSLAAACMALSSAALVLFLHRIAGTSGRPNGPWASCFSVLLEALVATPAVVVPRALYLAWHVDWTRHKSMSRVMWSSVRIATVLAAASVALSFVSAIGNLAQVGTFASWGELAAAGAPFLSFGEPAPFIVPVVALVLFAGVLNAAATLAARSDGNYLPTGWATALS